ncbi:MAG: hypothetical protein H0U19_08770 [Acidobacteria bacterium]|nr:hypothetical protein [Acidobacteriota bacterium]
MVHRPGGNRTAGPPPPTDIAANLKQLIIHLTNVNNTFCGRVLGQLDMYMRARGDRSAICGTTLSSLCGPLSRANGRAV